MENQLFRDELFRHAHATNHVAGFSHVARTTNDESSKLYAIIAELQEEIENLRAENENLLKLNDAVVCLGHLTVHYCNNGKVNKILILFMRKVFAYSSSTLIAVSWQLKWLWT